MIEAVLSKLEQRLGGRLYAKQRLGIETDHEAQVFGQGLTFFHIENWYSVHSATPECAALGPRQFGATDPKPIAHSRDKIRSKSSRKPLIRLLIGPDIS